MPCTVKKTFEASAAAGALLIAQVKDNQPTLHQHVEQVCQSKTPVDQDTSRDANRRSRDETRLVEVFDPDAALADTEWAEHVGAVIRVSRTTHRRVTATGLWETTSEVAYFVCECRPRSALEPSASTGRSKIGRITCATAASERTTAAFAAIPASSRACALSPPTSCASTTSKTSLTHATASLSEDPTPCVRYASRSER